MISAVISLPLVWERVPGVHILALRLGRSVWNWLVSVLVLVPITLIAVEIVIYLWLAIVPQTISSDCSGSADPVTVTMRGPIVQLYPPLLVAIGLWLLHIRALSVSPRAR